MDMEERKRRSKTPPSAWIPSTQLDRTPPQMDRMPSHQMDRYISNLDRGHVHIDRNSPYGGRMSAPPDRMYEEMERLYPYPVDRRMPKPMDTSSPREDRSVDRQMDRYHPDYDRENRRTPDFDHVVPMENNPARGQHRHGRRSKENDQTVSAFTRIPPPIDRMPPKMDGMPQDSSNWDSDPKWRIRSAPTAGASTTRGGRSHHERSNHPMDYPPQHQHAGRSSRESNHPAYVLRNIASGSGNRPLQIKRMKQLEQEKDMLIQGLESIERARDWYLTQIRGVQDKQKYVGKATGHNDYSVEAHQERMNFQHARISEVNQQLKALVESSEKGFPLHMNLALSQRVKPKTENTETSNVVSMLKGQNRLLTQEVSEKSDKISQLEREKATLIRDLFESRGPKTRKNNYEDTTFM